jgi:hypothetical protein
MNGKLLVVGTLAAALTLYVWQVISNVALPWHTATMHEWEGAANDAVVQAVRANAPENGVYVSNQGILAAVSMTPDLADKTQMMGSMLTRQVFINLAVGFLLALVLARSGPMTPMHAAVTFAIAGLAAGAVTELSNWNWYGFDLAFSLVNVVELTISWFLAGLVLAAVQRRVGSGALAPAGVRAPSGIGTGAPSTSARTR